MADEPPCAGIQGILTGRRVRLHLHTMALVPHTRVSDRCIKHSHCILHCTGLLATDVAFMCWPWSQIQKLYTKTSNTNHTLYHSFAKPFGLVDQERTKDSKTLLSSRAWPQKQPYQENFHQNCLVRVNLVATPRLVGHTLTYH